VTRVSKQLLHSQLPMLLIAAASCVRVLVCFQHNPMDYLWSDPLRHWVNGVHFPGGGYTGASDPIVYQVYVFVLHKLTRDHRLLVALASAMLSVLMPWTYYRAARDFGLAKTPALWVWALIALTPSFITIYHYIMMETLLLFLEGVALWTTARYLRKGGTTAFLVSVFVWTIACLTKPTVVPLAGICLLWGWWNRSPPLRVVAIGALLGIALLIPQAVRSRMGMGFVAPFGNPWQTKVILRSGTRVTRFLFYPPPTQRGGAGAAFKQDELIFVSPSCLVRPLEPLSSWAIRRYYLDSEFSFIINSAHGQQDWKDAYAVCNHDRGEWLAQWGENMVLFLFAPSWPDSAAAEWDGRMEFWARWMWAPLILFTLACNVREFLARRLELIPVATTLLTFLLLFQNVVLTEGRYRKPLEPLLLLNVVWVLNSKRMGYGRTLNRPYQPSRELAPATTTSQTNHTS
jgi:hypothetical protein